MISSKHENVRLKSIGIVGLLRVRISPVRVPNQRRPVFLIGQNLGIRCSIGPSGVTRTKREGDGATPVGRFALPTWRFQPVRPAFVRGALAVRALRRDAAWCDDPASGAYNREVRLPFRAGHEDLWRDDGKYAVVGVIDYNITRRMRGAGSAIFFHICDEMFEPTAGCIAIRASDMRKLLPRLSRRTLVEIS